MRGAGFGADLPAYFDAVEAWQHQIKDDAIRRRALNLRQTLVAIAHCDHLKTIAQEVV